MPQEVQQEKRPGGGWAEYTDELCVLAFLQVRPILSSATSVNTKNILLAVVPVVQADWLPTPPGALLQWL